MSEPQDTAREVSRWSPLHWLQKITGPWDRSNLFSMLRFIAIIFFVKGCVIDQYSIPSGSMEPTLHGDPRFGRGDRVLVNKWLFGPRIPFTAIRLWDWQEPKRWDIVVFEPVAGTSEYPVLIKRVAGLPGERVRITGGKLEVNGQVVPFPEAMPKEMHYFNDLDLLKLSWEHPADAKAIQQLRERYPLRYGVLEQDQFAVVPPEHYFVLGDNSFESVDGRVNGWIPRDNLHGRAFAVWWPFGRRRDFTGFSHTWWGWALMLGVPLLLIGLDMWSTRRDRRRRAAAASGEGNA